jgi:hypothetical protein
MASKVTLAAVVLAALSPAFLRAPCDVKVTEKGVYCPKEERDIFKGNVDNGKCANDGAEVKEIEICVKEHFV